MKILVAGGAGYIGSHMIKYFLHTDHEVAILDNLSTGYEDNCQGLPLHKIDLKDKDQVLQFLKTQSFDAVMHFASFINVGESYHHPEKYYQNNVINSFHLLEAMIECRIKNFIFSSSAAVYGEPTQIPINEDHPIAPVNPYGSTKAEVEKKLEEYRLNKGLNYISLRYFNACGAHPDGSIGERHNPETHLIPLILQAASGRRKNIQIHGDDYDTPDGTCVRDYIHVMDLVEAHILALNSLINNGQSAVYNIGNNQGFSVKEIIQAAETVTQKPIPIEMGERRKGDPAKLIANNQKIIQELNWHPRYSDLNTILSTAWQWEKKLAQLHD
jgi:UDP-glucose 4-epimerase